MKYSILSHPSGKTTALLVLACIMLGFQSPLFAQGPLTVDAGEDFTACQNNISLTGSAENYETVVWSTDGDGTFTDPENLSTGYMPGESDIAAGQVQLCLTAFATGDQVTDCVNAIIVAAPEINLNVEEDSVCFYDSYTFENSEFSNYTALQWFTPNGGGSFNNENIPNPTYYPSATVDYAQGCIVISVLAQGQNPCEFATADMLLCFTPNAQVDPGGDTHYACFGDDYTFEDATASATSSIQWYPITGGGYFENANEINATYVPDPDFDYPQGCIFVGLTAEPISPCTGTIEEFAEICFEPSPEVDAGADATVLSGQTFSPSASVSDYEILSWETSGDGSFDDAGTLSPTYFPGIADKQNGVVALTINAYSDNNCSSSDEMTLSIITQQTITIPEGLSGFSTYVNLQGLSLEEVIAPIADDLIFAQNMLQTYWPEYGINTFGNGIIPGAFKVVMSNPVTLPLAGSAKENTVDLPAGWSLLPVPVSCNVDSQVLTDQLVDDLIIITEINDDGMLWPGGGVFDLDQLLPGKAYLIKMANPAQLVFPECN
jgi:hypothetical protein